MSFSDLGLDSWLLKLAAKVQYRAPTAIQSLAVPPILRDQHTIISSQTGSGKTAAFAFPILQKLANDPFGIFAVVLTVNRELALQIAEQFSIFGASINLRIALLIGGIEIRQQINQLANIPHILIGTPGRTRELLQTDHNFRKYIQNAHYLVLDEVDRLVEPQIWHDIQFIHQKCTSPDLKIHLVSATITSVHPQLKDLFPDTDFKQCIANTQQQIVDTIKNKFILMPDLVKDYYLVYLLKKLEGSSSILFVPTCRF